MPDIDLPLRDPEPEPEAGTDPLDEPVSESTEAADGATAPRAAGSGMIAVGMLAIGLRAGFSGGFLVCLRTAPPVPGFADSPPPAPSAPVDSRAVGTGMREGADTPPIAAAPVVEAVPVPVAPAEIAVEPLAPPPDAVPSPVRSAPVPPPAPVAPPPPAVGTLQFASRPEGATIYLDDVRVGVTPMTMGNVRPGTYRVRMELFGHQSWLTAVDLAAGEQRRLGASFD